MKRKLYRASQNSSGAFPIMGAIFMSNRATREECFERGLFGLPFAHAEFVREVKIGMLLFLFEHEERLLYGVFEATSNGSINIVPDAYCSSRKQFPAQVEFRTLWQCEPLSQRQFGPVMKENYYSGSKFNFGLSEKQVYGLLRLFEPQRIEVPAGVGIPNHNVGDRQTPPPLQPFLNGFGVVECGSPPCDASAAAAAAVRPPETNPNNAAAVVQNSWLQCQYTCTNNAVLEPFVSSAVHAITVEHNYFKSAADYIPAAAPTKAEPIENSLSFKILTSGKAYQEVEDKFWDRKSVFSRLKVTAAAPSERNRAPAEGRSETWKRRMEMRHQQQEEGEKNPPSFLNFRSRISKKKSDGRPHDLPKCSRKLIRRPPIPPVPPAEDDRAVAAADADAADALLFMTTDSTPPCRTICISPIPSAACQGAVDPHETFPGAPC